MKEQETTKLIIIQIAKTSDTSEPYRYQIAIKDTPVEPQNKK